MQTVTSEYSLGYLSEHPQTKKIIHKYLQPLVGDMKYVEHINGTLNDLAAYNMGGGIPYETMVLLTKELNEIKTPLNH